MSIEEIKDSIINKYNINYKICYYYYLWNVVRYAGEKRVRESFESIAGQGDEIIIGNYCCEDNTREIAEEYGFKVIDIESDNNHCFPESKIKNKIIKESKSDFLVDLNINVEYPKQLTDIIKFLIRIIDIKKKFIRFRYSFELQDGKIVKYYGNSNVIYKPYLVEARGYDERTAYATGSQKYGSMLLTNVYKLKVMTVPNEMVHKYHNYIKLPILKKIYPNIDRQEKRARTINVVDALIGLLEKDLYKGINKVQNSYW